MSQTKPHAGAHTRVEFLRLAWSFGGKTEKSFVILVADAPVVLVGLLMVLVTHGFLSGARAEEYVISGVILLLLAASWIFYSPSILRPLNSTRVIRGLLETNAWSDPERAYLAELLRYKDALGKNGEITGDVAIGYVHAIIYYSLCVAYLVVVLAFYPRWGEIALGLFAAAALWIGVYQSGSVVWQFRQFGIAYSTATTRTITNARGYSTTLTLNSFGNSIQATGPSIGSSCCDTKENSSAYV